jgi:hypothetical protein
MNGSGRRETLTYSALNCWRNCPRKYKLRYREHLRPREKAETLAFGSTIHRALELWYAAEGDPHRLFRVLDLLDAAYPDREADPAQKAAWFQAKAMMAGYAARYPQEDFAVLELEKEFQGEIRNPATGATSKTFTMAGKADGIVRQGGDLYLLEHKTASSIDGAYLDRLWCDTQIALYSHYLREMGYPVVGVIYNVLLKTRLKQRQGETEEEYLERKAALAAKNKSGKSSAQRQEPESDEDFQARLADWYGKPDAFHREKIYLSEDRLAMVAEEVWEVTQQYLDARRRDSWLLNTSYCFNWSRPCEYFPYCQSGFNPILRDNLFDVVPPHEELAPADSSF